MSELVLVRHGQASFGAESYDKLSPTGIQQVEVLAQHWTAMGERFDCIYSGNLIRQRESAEILLPLLKSRAGTVTIHPGFNEYNGDPIISIYLRDHAKVEGFPAGLKLPISEEKFFQKIFEAATARWITGSLTPQQSDTLYESWEAFRNRVHTAIDELIDRHVNGSKVLVATSGGVIALALQRVLGFSNETAIATNWMVYNSSVTRIRYGNGKVSLTLFNGLSHLENPELYNKVTYR